MAPSFAGWADEIWLRSRESYGLTAARDAATLDALYPIDDPRFVRVRTADGWAVVLDTQMQNHKQFGEMRVGTIVDCMAPIGAAGLVIRAATSVLEARGRSDRLQSTSRAWSRGCWMRIPSGTFELFAGALARFSRRRRQCPR